MILSPSVRWFIDEGYLSDYEYYVPSELDTSGIHRVMGDFNKKELDERLKQSTGRIGSLVENYRKYADGKVGIAFGTFNFTATEINAKWLPELNGATQSAPAQTSAPTAPVQSEPEDIPF